MFLSKSRTMCSHHKLLPPITTPFPAGHFSMASQYSQLIREQWNPCLHRHGSAAVGLCGRVRLNPLPAEDDWW